MNEREYKIIDIDKINEDIESGKTKPIDDDPVEVLYDSLLDILQLSENEGLTVDEVDSVLLRVSDYRAEQRRKRFRLHVQEE